MIEISQLPRRYFVDNNARRVLVGLTIEETLEFEALDNLMALDESGTHLVYDDRGLPARTPESRWVELYVKHNTAWKRWMVETEEDRARNLTVY